MKILFIGPQGSGKSTQAKLLAQFINVPYLATGDIFRKLSREDTSEGRRIKKLYEEGKLIDDQTTCQIVKDILSRPKYQEGFVLDGYPRNLEQVKLFNPQFDKVFYLKLNDREATNRLLKRARVDDTAELIAERLKIYHKLTDPILDYYQAKGLLEEIDGRGTIDEIHKKIREELND